MAEVYGINGPVVTAINCKGFKISELVYVSQSRLIGEVIELLEDYTMIQVFEDTDLLKCGDKIYNTGEQLSVELAPGLLSNIFDGIQRPLKYIEELSPTFIKKGINIETLDRTKKWPVNIIAKLNAIVAPGDIIATVQETKSILHKIMVPHNIRGKIIEINKNGNYTLCQTIATLQDSMNTLHKITMLQKWPIRLPRPSKQRLVSKKTSNNWTKDYR